MPIYAYRCTNCGHAQDALQKLSDPVLTVCPACGQSTYAKQVTAAGFQLKGSGWYVTDFRGDGKGGKKADADTATPEDGKSDKADKPDQGDKGDKGDKGDQPDKGEKSDRGDKAGSSGGDKPAAAASSDTSPAPAPPKPAPTSSPAAAPSPAPATSSKPGE